MSHLKERKEKTCLNCQTNPLYGRYCHASGQENLEPKESVGRLILHFFSDITHFDGKFFSTVKYLMKKPGFLSYEYMIGRRASYLNPIRMYVFTSAIFFLILFSLRSSQSHGNITTHPDTKNGKSTTGINLFGWNDGEYKTVEAYDSTQNKAPAGRQDSWLKRIAMRRLIIADQEIEKDSRSYFEHLLGNFLHSFPKILFFSLPFFALILRLLYVRRKQYLYVDHGIFTIHLYCATFILVLAGMLLREISNRTGLGWVQKICSFSIFVIFLYIFIYLYLAMRAFYRQGRGKTLLKYILLGIMGLALNYLLLALFFLISAISI